MDRAPTVHEAGKAVADRVTEAAAARLGDWKLGPEYCYRHLPLCIIDAVFSIGVRYKGVQKVAGQFREVAGPGWGDADDGDPERSVTDLLSGIAEHPAEALAARVFRNRQRTSPRNGILKAEAVRRVAHAFVENGVERRADWRPGPRLMALERAVRQIPGQTSGLPFHYIGLLAGDENAVKPDRMVVRFVQSSCGPMLGAPFRCKPGFAADAVREAARELKERHPSVTPRLLDNVIWHLQRGTDPSAATPCRT